MNVLCTGVRKILEILVHFQPVYKTKTQFPNLCTLLCHTQNYCNGKKPNIPSQCNTDLHLQLNTLKPKINMQKFSHFRPKLGQLQV